MEFMRRHHRRIPYLHLKSVDREVPQRVNVERIPFTKAVAMERFLRALSGRSRFQGFPRCIEHYVLSELGDR